MLLDHSGRRPPTQGRHTLSFMHLNMRNSSVCGHLLVEFLRRQSVDVLMLQDTCDSLRTRFGVLRDTLFSYLLDVVGGAMVWAH